VVYNKNNYTMTITFTSGISFSGGFTFTPPPPPPENTAGWFGGGVNPAAALFTLSLVDRITYATDTATASVRGPLSVARYGLAAASNI
jgi:hypothetical protein